MENTFTNEEIRDELQKIVTDFQDHIQLFLEKYLPAAPVVQQQPMTWQDHKTARRYRELYGNL